MTTPTPTPAGSGHDLGPGLSIVGSGLELHTRQGRVLSDIRVNVPEGQILGICGPEGSGRTSLALILCGRMKFRSGKLEVGGMPMPQKMRWLRANSVLAPTGEIYGLEGALRVREEVQRTLKLTGKRHTRLDAGQILQTAGLTGQERTLVRDLPVLSRRRFEIACAFADQARLVVVDDLQQGIPHRFQAEIWRYLKDVAVESGATVVATFMDPEPASDVCDQLLPLEEQTDRPVLSNDQQALNQEAGTDQAAGDVT